MNEDSITVPKNSTKSNNMISQNEFEQYARIDKERDTLDLESLVDQFKDKKTPFRQNALYKINQRNYNKIDKLLEFALDDEDELIKIIAIQSIKDNMQIECLKKLIEIYRDSNNYILLTNINKTFVTFETRKPVPLLLEKLKSKNDMIVYDSILTLGEIGSKDEIEVLEAIKSNKVIPKIYDENGILSQSTIYTIGEMAKKSIEKIKARVRNEKFI